MSESRPADFAAGRLDAERTAWRPMLTRLEPPKSIPDDDMRYGDATNYGPLPREKDRASQAVATAI